MTLHTEPKKAADTLDTHFETGLFVGPPLTIEMYAKIQGVSTRTITEQIHKGYLPTIKIGKRRLINTYKLASDCLKPEISSND